MKYPLQVQTASKFLPSAILDAEGNHVAMLFEDVAAKRLVTELNGQQVFIDNLCNETKMLDAIIEQGKADAATARETVTKMAETIRNLREQLTIAHQRIEDLDKAAYGLKMELAVWERKV